MFDIGTAAGARRCGRCAGSARRCSARRAAPIARIRGRHRVRLLVKAAKGAPLQAALAEWVAQVKLPANVRLSIDIDPQSFY